MQPTSWQKNLIWVILAFLIVWLNRQHFFFWDTVQLTSMHAHWFYDRHFSVFFLPPNYDSGHPPFWGMYHALLWQLFGKSLTVSHLGMFPFLFGVFYFADKVGVLLTQNRGWGLYFGLFLVADSVFLTQASLVSPDVALVCFFLMTLAGLLQAKQGEKRHLNTLMMIGAIGLSMISLRGMMTLAGLGFYLIFDLGIRRGLRQMWNFLPGIFVGFGFLLAHSLHTHWIGYHADSPWADSFQLVDFQGIIKNSLVLIWRLLDVGRMFIWILLLFIGWRYRVGISTHLWRLFGALSLTLLPTFLLYRGLNGMRYLLPLMITMDLIFVRALWYLRRQGDKRWLFIYIFSFLAFATGHTWQYPQNISMSWDTTLLHSPYYSLRKKMMAYIQEENIPIPQIATAFPNTAPLEIIDLNEISESMTSLDDPNAKYIFLSNIFNDAKHQRQDIQKKYPLLKKFESHGIWVALYRKAELHSPNQEKIHIE